MKNTKRKLAIITYHRVLAERDPLRPFQTYLKQFETHMRALFRYFNVLKLADAVSRMKAGTLPPGAVCITFDDGYSDNISVALPVLQRYGFCATFFIATGYLNGGRMWNDTVVESLRRLPYGSFDLTPFEMGRIEIDSTHTKKSAIDFILRNTKYLSSDSRQDLANYLALRADAPLPDDLMMTDNGVRELHDAGMEIGAHTVTHPILTQVSPQVASDELAGSREFLTNLVGGAVTSFAYPNGKPHRDYDAGHVAAVRDAGFQLAVSTSAAAAHSNSDVFQLPRLSMADRNATIYSLRLAKYLIAKKTEEAVAVLL